jgi:hypothetical protein
MALWNKIQLVLGTSSLSGQCKSIDKIWKRKLCVASDSFDPFADKPAGGSVSVLCFE